MVTQQTGWQEVFKQRLPLLGHRNWIVIADGAYPWQTARGIETVVTGADQIEVITAVMKAIDLAPHVHPLIYTDAELPFLAEDDAHGIHSYREKLATALGSRGVQSLPHDAIIAKLDKAGQTFHILLLKTTLTLPYTSVFIELDCGYWNAEAEKKMRQAFNSK